MKPQPIILGETFTFTRTYWKSFRVIYTLCFFLVFILFFLFIARVTPHFVSGYFLAIYFVILLFSIRAWGFLTRVTISPDGLTYSAPFRTKTLDWSSIKSAGMYVQNKNTKDELPVHRYKEKFYLREKFIFLTRYPNYTPGYFSFFDMDYFDFHYRDKAWELIEFYLGKKENKTFNFQ